MNEMKLFELARKGDKVAKEKIVSDNAGLIWSIARRYIGRGYDVEEIYQIGCIGMLKAIDRFEFDYGVKFSTYAVPLISGEIKRFLRDNGMIKVSRILKQNGYKISMARQQLSAKYGREATIEELSKETHLDIEDIIMATEANKDIESIYQTVYGNDGREVYLVDQIADATMYTAADGMINKLMLEQTLDEMEDKHRRLIEMRYYQDKTQSEVAKELGISQVQVSRLEKKLLGQMRQKMQGT